MITFVTQALTKTEAYVIEDTLGVIALFSLLFFGLTFSGAL